ncbi:MAG: ABC transporter substrate-binding protein [Atopobiaceae bacterium]|jgi:polar amino acid transport system substrate-binding protein
MLTRKQFVTASVSALGAGALSACSNNAGSSASSSESSSDSYTLAESGKLLGASDLQYPPLSQMNETTGEPEGFEIDLLAALAGKLGLEAGWIDPIKFDAIIPLIQQGGKADVGLSAFTITDDRLKQVDFTDPYLDSNQGVVVKGDQEGDPEDYLNDANMKVAAQSGTTGESWVQENLPNAQLIPLDDVIQAMTGVSTGLYNACVADLPVVSNLTLNSYTDLKVVLQIPTGEQYGIVVSKDNPKLTEELNKALQEIESDGTMDSLKTKWFGGNI